MSNPVETPNVEQPTPPIEQSQPAITTPPAAPPSTREEIYANYYNTQPAAPETPQPPTPPVADAAAPPAQAPPPNVEELVKRAVETTLRSLMPTNANQPAPTTPPSVVVEQTPPDPTEWIQYLTKGDFATATEKLREQIITEVRNSVVPDVERSTLAAAVENFKAEQDLTAFVNSVKAENPDIVKLEHLMAPSIQYEMAKWTSAQGGKFAPAAYVEKYKQVLTAAVDDARQLIQTFRAAGGTEKTTVKNEVLSSAPLTPSPVQAPPPTTGQPQLQTASDYIKMREQMQLRRMGAPIRQKG